MAKLADIVKPGVPCKVKDSEGSIYEWDGGNLYAKGTRLIASTFIFNDYWQPVSEPTVESVLRERGYECRSSNWGWDVGFNNGQIRFRCESEKRPTTPEQASALCDFLDQYKDEPAAHAR